MAKPSTLFEEEIRAYQEYALNYGKCSICDRGMTQGENVYVGYLDDGSLVVACESCKARLAKTINQFVYHPKEFQVPPRNTILWRYQDFPKFVSLLDSGELYFTRADKFEDKFEGARGFNFQKDAIYASMKTSLLYKAKKQLIDSGINDPSDLEIDNQLNEEIAALLKAQDDKRQDYFVSCWHANERESEAMWKLYITAKKQGVAIQTTMERLCYSIGKSGFDVGAVNYISYEKPLEVTHTPIWYKRTAFQHENEVRAIFHEAGSKIDGMPVKMDLDLLIEKVYISPSAPGWFAELVKNVLKKYGLNKNVEHSKLDETPVY